MKKNRKMFGIIFLLLICISGGVAYIKITSYDYIGQYNEWGLAKAEKNGKYGFINENKKVIVPVEYDEVGTFTDNGVVIVKRGDKEGCMNVEGTVIFPAAYSEIKVGDCSGDGLTFVQADDEETFIDVNGRIVYEGVEETDVWDWKKVKLNGRYGCVDENGNVILPCEYEELDIGTQHSNSADVRLNGKLNFVSYTGDILYDEIGEFNDNGWAKVKRNDKYGYIDESGDVMVPIQYETVELGKFQDNGYAKLTASNTINFVNKYGELLYKNVRPFSMNNLAAAQNEDGYWGFIDSDGEQVTSFYYDEVGDFGENGLAKIKNGNYYGYVNELGVEMIRPGYDELSDFGESGLVLARNGKRYDFINSVGIKQYDKVFEFSEEGVAAARLNGKYFFVDKEGNRINDLTYDMINSFDDGKMFRIRIGAKYGLANGKGEEIVSVIYDGVTRYCDGVYELCDGALFGAVSSEGKWLCDVIYKEIKGINAEKQRILLQIEENRWQLIDWEGKIILDVDAEDVAWYTDFYLSAQNGDKYSVYSLDGKLLFEECDSCLGFLKEENAYVEIEINGKSGLIDLDGNIILDLQYDDIMNGYGTHFVVKKDKKYGIVDDNGNFIVEPLYSSIRYNDTGIKDLSYYVVSENGKYGYWNASSMELVIPYQFDFAMGFHDGLAVVKAGQEYGLINEKGQFVLAPSYDCIEDYYDYYYYLNEERFFEISQNDKYGLLDQNGNVILWPSYDDVDPYFAEGLIRVEDQECYGVLKYNGEWILSTNYSYVGYEEEYNLIWANDMDDIRHYFDMEGNEIISYGDWRSSISDDGLITVREGEGYSLYDATGRYVNYLEYESVSMFFGGLSRARDWEYDYGFINENGEIVIPFEYDDAGHFSEDGIVSVCKEGKWGFLDESGGMITECIYDEVEEFSYGRAAVCRNGKWGYINAAGEEVISLQYDSVSDYSHASAHVYVGTGEDEKRYIINYIGEVIDTY